jgi:hypothetical protein
MANGDLTSVCGIYCGGCEYLGEMCKGCGAEKGEIFWTKSDEIPLDVCPLWKCCVDEKQLEHCGLCSEFPCKIYLEMKDPEDPEADLHKKQNIESLRRRVEIGTEKWLEEMKACSE